NNPVRLLHRSGHACVLNSAALALAGIDGSTPEPLGAAIERDLTTGEPNGVLLNMNEAVDRVVPPLSEGELEAAVREAGRRLLGYGVTFVQDATHTNGLDDWRLMERLLESGAIRLRVSMMECFEALGTLPECGAGGRLTRGPVKVMPRELEHDFMPDAAELASMLRRVRDVGRTAAVHAVTRRGVRTVLDAFESLGPSAMRHRLEHCGVCGPEEARRIARLGLTVATQPGFLYENGDLMAQRVAAPDVPDLYPLRRLLDDGISMAGSSDAPVALPDPISGMRAAVQRRSRGGEVLAADQAVSAVEALALFTASAAAALGLAGERGRIRPGLSADLAVLSQDPLSPGVDWDALRVGMTIVDGEVDFEA
ncbi:MAG TPA: amidohydrolase family protein, partial [Dehalococcoidia bacterium]